ncbi:hypothetical protein pipiens_017541, partial [Culex pipiens pipiens]
TIYHKINYVAPGSTLKVATYAAAAPAHYEYAAAVPGLTKYPVVPTAAAPLYATASTSPNQFYHQPTNYGDPDTLTNFNTSPRPTGSGFKPYNRKTHVKPVIEYDYDRDRFTSGEEPCEDDIYAYNPPSVDKKKKNGTSSFDRNLQTLIRTYGVATALLRASNQAGDKQKKKKSKQNGPNGDNTDRIQLIHPPSDGDKKLKPGKGGSSNGRKYYHYHYDHDHDDYHHGGDGYGYGRRGYDKHSYRRTLDR